MSKYGLYGKLPAAAGKGDELRNILIQAANLVSKAKGCLMYIVNQEVDNPDVIWVTEMWESKEDHANSLGMPGVKELIGQAMPIMAGRPEQVRLEVQGGVGVPE